MKRTITLSTILILSAACCFATANNDSAISKMTVQGTGKIEVPANQFQLNIGVQTIAKTVDSAMQENSLKMNNIEKAITAIGINKKEYKTSGFSLNPMFSEKPKNADQNWTKEIVGYQVNNSYQIQSTNLGIIGNLIQKTTAAGANNISDITFGLSEPYKYRAEAIKCAVKNATKDAEALAAAAGQEIVNITELRLNNFYMPTMRMANASFALEASGSSHDVPVNPGMITLNVSVNIEYKIESKIME